MLKRFKRFSQVKRLMKTAKRQEEPAEPKPAAPLGTCPCCSGRLEAPEGLVAAGIIFVQCVSCRRVSVLGCHRSDYIAETDPDFDNKIIRLVEFIRVDDEMRRAPGTDQRWESNWIPW